MKVLVMKIPPFFIYLALYYAYTFSPCQSFSAVLDFYLVFFKLFIH